MGLGNLNIRMGSGSPRRLLHWLLTTAHIRYPFVTISSLAVFLNSPMEVVLTSNGVLRKRPDHPWYPAAMRLSTVTDLKYSFLDDIKNIFNPRLFTWLYRHNAWSSAGASPRRIHFSNESTFVFSVLFNLFISKKNTKSEYLLIFLLPIYPYTHLFNVFDYPFTRIRGFCSMAR